MNYWGNWYHPPIPPLPPNYPPQPVPSPPGEAAPELDDEPTPPTPPPPTMRILIPVIGPHVHVHGRPGVHFNYSGITPGRVYGEPPAVPPAAVPASVLQAVPPGYRLMSSLQNTNSGTTYIFRPPGPLVPGQALFCAYVGPPLQTAPWLTNENLIPITSATVGIENAALPAGGRLSINEVRLARFGQQTQGVATNNHQSSEQARRLFIQTVLNHPISRRRLVFSLEYQYRNYHEVARFAAENYPSIEPVTFRYFDISPIRGYVVPDSLTLGGVLICWKNYQTDAPDTGDYEGYMRFAWEVKACELGAMKISGFLQRFWDAGDRNGSGEGGRYTIEDVRREFNDKFWKTVRRRFFPRRRN